MADQRVKEIGEEELRFVLKTQSRKAVLAKVIRKLCNTTTLPGLLSSRNGNLCVAGVEATAEIRKIVDDAVRPARMVRTGSIEPFTALPTATCVPCVRRPLPAHAPVRR